MKLEHFLLIGTILMGVPIFIVAKAYQIKIWKIIPFTAILTLVGTYGTRLMFYIENKVYGGLSFYGAVFLVPIAFIVVALLLNIPYGKATDMCAVGECIMLVLMKIHCMISGCCIGRELFVTTSGTEIRFPSRLIEMIVAFAIFVFLMHWAIKKIHMGGLYAWYLVLYGTTRFVLNICREEWTLKETILPPGNIWSIVAVVIGFIVLAVRVKQRKKNLSA